MSLPKETKRKLRQEVYFLTKNGFFKHTDRLKIYDPLYTERLLGKFGFWKQVEPENHFVIKSIKNIQDTQDKLNSLI